MRIVRALTALFIAALLGSSMLAAVPANAADSLPERIITGATERKTYKAFKLSGTIEAFPGGKAKLQKKACGKCGFKTVKKVKTSAYGSYTTRIYGPPGKGTWKWRIKVPAGSGYATSFSAKFATFNK